MKHTPGPWNISTPCKRDANGVPCAWLNLDAPGHIGGMKIETHYSMPDDEMNANARLIAAAPDLLAACKALAESIAFRIDDPRAKLRDAALAAIAKATK